MTIQLGKKVKDVVSGFTGTATARSEYLNGCVRYCVEALDKTNNSLTELWFDEQRLEPIERGEDVRPRVRKTGGTRPAPPRTGSRA